MKVSKESMLFLSKRKKEKKEGRKKKEEDDLERRIVRFSNSDGQKWPSRWEGKSGWKTRAFH